MNRTLHQASSAESDVIEPLGGQILEALSVLPATEQKIAALHWLEGMTFAEIALVLDLAPAVISDAMRNIAASLSRHTALASSVFAT